MRALTRKSRIVVSNAADFGKVAVMSGGYSTEREVSLETGNAVLKALKSRRVNAIAWDPSENSINEFAEAGFDRAWIALHGSGGEDGAIQGALQWLNTPYTGSGVMASALAMDKIRSKRLFLQAGIPTPDFVVVENVSDAMRAADEFGYPLILKPSNQGSSVGMTKVFDARELEAAVTLAQSFDAPALAERFIVGDEMTIAVLQGEALPSIRIDTPRVFYDYRAKYQADSTRYRCPGTDDPELEEEYRRIALEAFQVLGCSGWGRVDFLVDGSAHPQILEVNTVPGMTSHSLVPMAAKAVGIDFAELCWRILETSIVQGAQLTPVEAAANDA